MRALSVLALVSVCSCGGSTITISDAAPGEDAGPTVDATVQDTGSDVGVVADVGADTSCATRCSPSTHEILDCNDQVVTTCAPTEACDVGSTTCVAACDAQKNNMQSTGCDFYPAYLEVYPGPARCHALIMANTWGAPAKVQLTYNGQQLSVANFARIPKGSGKSLTYDPYDAMKGIPPGEVAIAFLGGDSGNQGCPVPPAFNGNMTQVTGTTVGKAFHLTSDVPLAVYQVNPYGFGAYSTGSSLLLPTTAWGTNYVVNTASPKTTSSPSFDVVARENGTQIDLLPKANVSGGGNIPSGIANKTLSFTINAGEVAQLSQDADLAGSVIVSSKPVGVWSSSPCMNVPQNVFYCDHGEQMQLPINALASEYAAVPYRPRAGEPALWRIVGVTDGTSLTFAPAVMGAPTTIGKGQIAEFESSAPFVVSSQDAAHPFQAFAYMSGGQWNKLSALGYGDPDHVVITPPGQWQPGYVFFTDPTFPETNVVVVRQKVNGTFQDVNLDCLGNLTGWQALGASYEWTRTDLQTGDFQAVGNCSNGRHTITSKNPFGLWVWGWGSPKTSIYTQNVSYGYPGGTNVRALNNVTVPAK